MVWTNYELGTIMCDKFWILYDPDPGTTGNFTAYHGDQELGRTSTLQDAKTLVSDLADLGVTADLI